MVTPMKITPAQISAVESGVLTSPALIGQNVLADNTKKWADDIHQGKIVRVRTSIGETHTFQIQGNSINALVVTTNIIKSIPIGSSYEISEFDIDTVLRVVFGGGANISAANPLEVHDPKVGEVEGKLDHPSYGLAALKALIDSLAGGAFYGSYGPKNVEVDNDVDFGTILYDPVGNIITTGEITPGTYTIRRVRGAIDTEIVPAAASSEAAGRVYITYNFPAASWNIGDIFYVTFSGIIVTLNGVTTEYPNLFIWGRVVREAGIETKVDAIEGKLEVAQYYDKIFYDSVIGAAGITWPTGTPQAPSNDIANVITMCVARNLHTISVHGALTLTAMMEHYNFIGYSHETLADILSLGGQDVDGSHMEGLFVTGTQAGAGFLTLERCVIYNLLDLQGKVDFCDLFNAAIRFKDDGYIDMFQCNSIYGTVTITVQAPKWADLAELAGDFILTAQSGGVLRLDGFKGSLEIDAMTAGTLNVYANGADITINDDCIGTGFINIYGNARVTDNCGAGTTVTDYTKETQLNTIETAIAAIAGVNTYQEVIADQNFDLDLIDDLPLDANPPDADAENSVVDIDAIAGPLTTFVLRSLIVNVESFGSTGGSKLTFSLWIPVDGVITEVDSVDVSDTGYQNLMDLFGLQEVHASSIHITVVTDATDTPGDAACSGTYRYAKAS